MTVADWMATLDSLESELHAVQRSLRTDEVLNVARFVPPEGLGPLPAELAERARELLGQLSATTEQMSSARERAAARLRELRTIDPRGPRPAAALDTQL